MRLGSAAAARWYLKGWLAAVRGAEGALRALKKMLKPLLPRLDLCVPTLVFDAVFARQALGTCPTEVLGLQNFRQWVTAAKISTFC